jgi:hypothetical protein
MEKTVTQFLKALHIPVSEKYVQKLIASHPDFPSLLSISDTLTRLGINHAARRVKKDELIEIAYPYLLPVGNNVLLIKSAADLTKHNTDLDYWTEVVLQAEPTNQTKDKLNNELHARETTISKLGVSLLVLLGGLLAYLFITSFSVTSFLLLVTSFAGVAVGYLLLAKELGVTYAAVDAFCNAGKNTNCDRVLKADIKLFGIGLSEAVITFFIFQSITLILAQALPKSSQGYFAVLAALSLVTLPIIAFSVYYQYFVAKTWCRLCLIVVAILVVQFVVFGSSYVTGVTKLITYIPMAHLLASVLLFASIGLLILLIKAYTEHANKLEKVGMYGNRVKHSIPVFTHLLLQEQKIDDTPFKNEMLLGNPDAPVKLLMVTNLYCNPCKNAHGVISELIQTYPDQVSVALRFIQSGKDEVAINVTVPYLLGYWLQHIKGTRDESKQTEKLIHDWFEVWDLEKFKGSHALNNADVGEAKTIATWHYAFANREMIQSTPTFFLNGQKLPKEYSLDDFLPMIPELSTNINKLMNKQFTKVIG